MNLELEACSLTLLLLHPPHPCSWAVSLQSPFHVTEHFFTLFLAQEWSNGDYRKSLSLSFFFFWLHLATCRIFIPQPGVEPWPRQWKPQVLTTGLPENSLNSVFYLKSKPQVLDNFLALCYFSNKYQYLLNSHSRHHQPEMNDAVSCTLCPSCSALAKNAFPDLFLRK